MGEAQPILVAFLLGWVFLRTGQGLGIFDEYVHLPLISTIAAGEIPPRYFVNSEVNFAYHYGFQLLGASLMRLGGMFPWSAFDLSKAIVWGYGVALAWLVGKRCIRHEWGGVLTAAALVFASGTRYLLMLIPQGILIRVNNAIAFQGDEAVIGLPFSDAISQPWLLDGGPPVPFIFGYLSGIGEPFLITHAGINALNVVLLLLVWLLAGRARSRWALPLWVVLFAFWALTAETSYGVFAIGGVLAAAYSVWQSRGSESRKAEKSIRVPIEACALLLSAPVALLQGGLLTEIARGILTGSGGAAGFSLRWPPAILSKHLGPLSLFSPFELFVALFELGPVILFTPWLTAWAWRKFRAGEWILGALIISAWAGFVVPIFVNYQSERDMARIIGHGTLLWTLMLVVLLFEYRGRWRRYFQPAAGISLALMSFSGVMTAASMLTAGPGVTLPYRFTEADAWISAQTWDALAPGAEVFDHAGWRATALTGRLTRAITGGLSFATRPRPEWEALTANPSVEGCSKTATATCTWTTAGGRASPKPDGSPFPAIACG
ncbi:MAG: hypothetical protein ACE5GO_06175 [Anaerolineales bacterium]